jgi:hypothetical protein
MRKLILLGALAVAGCGGQSSQLFTVGALRLNAVDQLYLSRPTGNDFCGFVPTGQIKIQYFDYAPACPLDRQGGQTDPRDPTVEHTQLDIVMGGFYPGGPHENISGNNCLPTAAKCGPVFTASKVNCTLGPGDEVTAYFYHFPANSMNPDNTIQVDSGSVSLTQFDKTNAMPVKGSFDLVFGGSHVTGTINALDCDVAM